MTKFWKRRLTITINGVKLKLDDLQTSFEVRQTNLQHPDWAHSRIINLLPDKSTQAFNYGSYSIEAGYYEGPYGLLFTGDIMEQRRGKLSGTDRYHDTLATAGGKAYSHAKVQDTIDNATVDQQIEAAVKAFEEKGIPRGQIDTFGGKPGNRSATMNDPAHVVLRKAAETVDMFWSVSRGRLNVINNKNFKSGTPLKIDADSGMIGIPEQTLTGIVVKILMRADVEVGQAVQIDPDVITRYISPEGRYGGVNVPAVPRPGIPVDGKYKIVRVDHDGNLFGQEWYTTLTCLDPRKPGLAGASPGNQLQTGLPENSTSGGNQGGKP